MDDKVIKVLVRDNTKDSLARRIVSLNKEISEKDDQIAMKESHIAMLNREIYNLRSEIDGGETARLRREIKELEEKLKKYETASKLFYNTFFSDLASEDASAIVGSAIDDERESQYLSRIGLDA